MPRRSGSKTNRSASNGNKFNSNTKLFALLAGAIAVVAAFAAFSMLILPQIFSSNPKTQESTVSGTNDTQPLVKAGAESSSVNGERKTGAEVKEGRLAIEEYLKNNPDHTKLILEACEISDDDLSAIADCVECKHLVLVNNNLSGPGLKYLEKLKNLTFLNLAQNDIRNAGLKSLIDLTNLKQLDLSFNRHIAGGTFRYFGEKNKLDSLSLEGTEMSDNGLKSLSHLGAIVSLNLSDIPITEAGVKSLCSIKNLADLDLSKTNLSKTGLEYLCKNRPTLRSVMIRNTNIGDASVPDILRLRNLQVLDISGTTITDSGFLKLAELPKLQQLWCAECEAQKAIAQLKKSKPKLHVYEGVRIRGRNVPPLETTEH